MLGLFGGIAVILIFLLLIWRLMIIANNASDLFGALLVVGVLGHIAIQVILNVAVVTNSMPNTGVSLPFISYGGSSILFLLIEMGLVMSVAAASRSGMCNGVCAYRAFTGSKEDERFVRARVAAVQLHLSRIRHLCHSIG